MWFQKGFKALVGIQNVVSISDRFGIRIKKHQTTKQAWELHKLKFQDTDY